VLTEERDVADYFESTLAVLMSRTQIDQAAAAKAVSNFVMTDVRRVLNEGALAMEDFDLSPDRLATLIRLRIENKLSSSGAQALFDLLLQHESDPESLARDHNLLQISDAGALEPIVHQVIDTHPQQLNAYLNGKEGLLGFFIGQVMRAFPGSPDPQVVRSMILERIDALKTQD
jgi:aspartyl-tRNA(Asn)/glutamyl-tRNA(Gln) amidotransferase subunit B